MRIKAALAAIGLAFAIAPVLYPETTSAYPKCNIKACKKLSGTYSRQEISAACQQAGGIELGTQAQSGGYGCYGDASKGQDNFVECDDKGQCIGGPPAKRSPKGPRQELESILAPRIAPAKR